MGDMLSGEESALGRYIGLKVVSIGSQRRFYTLFGLLSVLINR